MEANYQIEQIVCGKVNGYPWWPGFIKSKSEEEVEVVFFGDFSRAILTYSKVKSFDSHYFIKDKRGQALKKALKSVERVQKNETTIAEEWQKVELANQKRKKTQTKRKIIKKAKKPIEIPKIEDEVSLTGREKAKYQKFIRSMDVQKSHRKSKTKRDNSNSNKSVKTPKSAKKKVSDDSIIVNPNTALTKNEDTETKVFPEDIKNIEEILNDAWLYLRSVEFDVETSLRDIREAGVKTLQFHPYIVYNSQVGALLTRCKNVCEFKVKEGVAKYEPILQELLKHTNLICDYLIRDGFLMENNVFEEYIDLSKRSSVIKTETPEPINQIAIPESKQEPDMGMELEEQETPVNKQVEETESCDMDKKLNLQISEPETEMLTVSEQIAFRVKRKFAKTIYHSNQSKSLRKKSCENLATAIESCIRKDCMEIQEYKKRVIGVVKRIEEGQIEMKEFLFTKEESKIDLSRMKELINNL